MLQRVKKISLAFFMILSYDGAALAVEDKSPSSFIEDVDQSHNLSTAMSHMQSSPEFLYKILSKEGWQKSQNQKLLQLPPMDNEFIHLATEQQLTHVTSKFWSGMDYVVLKVKVGEMEGSLKHETNPGGTTKYFHLYDGSIPLSAVADCDIVNQQS